MAYRRSQWIAAVVLWSATVALAQPGSHSLRTPSAGDGNAAANATTRIADPPTPSAGASEAPTPAEAPTSNPVAPAPANPSLATQPAASTAPAGEGLVRANHGRSQEDKPLKEGSDSNPSTGDWWQTLAALALVVGMILGLKKVLRRFGTHKVGVGPGGSRVVEVLSRTAVGSRQQVMLVRVGQRLLVVGAGSESLSTLAEITDPEEIAQLLGAAEQARANSLSNNFAKTLRGWRAQMSDLSGQDDDGHGEARPSTPAARAVSQVKAMILRLRGGSGQGGGNGRSTLRGPMGDQADFHTELDARQDDDESRRPL